LSLVYFTAPFQKLKLELQSRINMLEETSRGLQFNCLLKAVSAMKLDQVAQVFMQPSKPPRRETTQPLGVTSR